MNYMLGFDHNLYVTKDVIPIITGNISLIITVDIMQRFNKTNSFPIYFIIIKY